MNKQPIDDGGAAFPLAPVGTGDPRDGMAGGSTGMSLRAWLAGQALAGMDHSGVNSVKAALWAVEVADAVINQLNK